MLVGHIEGVVKYVLPGLGPHRSSSCRSRCRWAQPPDSQCTGFSAVRHCEQAADQLIAAPVGDAANACVVVSVLLWATVNLDTFVLGLHSRGSLWRY